MSDSLLYYIMWTASFLLSSWWVLLVILHGSAWSVWTLWWLSATFKRPIYSSFPVPNTVQGSFLLHVSPCAFMEVTISISISTSLCVFAHSQPSRYPFHLVWMLGIWTVVHWNSAIWLVRVGYFKALLVVLSDLEYLHLTNQIAGIITFNLLIAAYLAISTSCPTLYGTWILLIFTAVRCIGHVCTRRGGGGEGEGRWGALNKGAVMEGKHYVVPYW